MPRSKIQERIVVVDQRSENPLPWEVFFKCQRAPVLRSQLLSCLMSGIVIPVERVHSAALLDVVLLATAARRFCDAEIVDDYQALLQRIHDEWAKPEWTCAVFDSIHMSTADFILLKNGEIDFPGADVAYIPDLVQWYLDQDVPEYFSKELTK